MKGEAMRKRPWVNKLDTKGNDPTKRNLRRFDPLPSDHPLIGMECKACEKEFAPGDATTLIPIGPGGDQEAREDCREGRTYNSESLAVHWACATGIEPEPPPKFEASFLNEALGERARAIVREILRTREELICAWIAKTGIPPDRAVIVEMEIPGGRRIWIEERGEDDRIRFEAFDHELWETRDGVRTRVTSASSTQTYPPDPNDPLAVPPDDPSMIVEQWTAKDIDRGRRVDRAPDEDGIGGDGEYDGEPEPSPTTESGSLARAASFFGSKAREDRAGAPLKDEGEPEGEEEAGAGEGDPPEPSAASDDEIIRGGLDILGEGARRMESGERLSDPEDGAPRC